MKRPLDLTPPPHLLVDAEGVARMLGISRAMVFKLDSSGRLPSPVRLGKCTRWRVAELVAWGGARCPSREHWSVLQSNVDHERQR